MIDSEWVRAEVMLHDGEDPVPNTKRPVLIRTHIEGDTMRVEFDKEVEWEAIDRKADQIVVYLQRAPIAFIKLSPVAGVGDSVELTI